jgi:hypothetical protein
MLSEHRMTGPGAPVAALLPSRELSLTERDLSPKTLEVCLHTGRQLAGGRGAGPVPEDPGQAPARRLAVAVARHRRPRPLALRRGRDPGHARAARTSGRDREGHARSAHARLSPGDRLRASYPHKPLLEGTWVT